MDIETKRRSAIEFFIASATGGADPALRAEDFTFWNPQIGELTAAGVDEASVVAMSVFKRPMTIHIDGTTAERNRVAIEARSEAELINGVRYANTYHILIEFNDDGKVRRMNEHLDSKHMADTVSPLLLG
jgi:ketosteroid isomerase-like protein